jgi:uncharacterized membrane protein
MTDTRLQRRIEEYWGWIAVALFLLLSLDLLTTYFALATVGVEGEANPLMAWLLGQSLLVVVGVHLLVTVLAVGCFAELMRLYRRTDSRYRRTFGVVVELWLGLLVAAGLVVFANNLSVVVLSRSLF